MKARGETSGRDAKEEESEDFKNDGTRGDLPRKRLRRGKATPRAAGDIGTLPMFAALENSGSKGGRAAKKKTMPAPQEPSTTTTAELSGSKALGSGKRESSEDNPKSSEEKKRKVMEAIVPKETNSDSDISTTALYEQIDAAQKRVASLKQRLSQTAPKLSQKNSRANLRLRRRRVEATSTRRKRLRGSSGKRGTSRKAEAYDINNVISAQGPAKVCRNALFTKTIATPKVRAASTYVSPAQIATDGESSDEDVSDAVYIERHAKLEVDEPRGRARRSRAGRKRPKATADAVGQASFPLRRRRRRRVAELHRGSGHDDPDELEVIERAVVDGSSSCSDQNFCCTTASRLKRPQTADARRTPRARDVARSDAPRGRGRGDDRASSHRTARATRSRRPGDAANARLRARRR